MKYVVSANYRDRSSRYKWLVRRDTDDCTKAIACTSVVVKGVEFHESNQFERGFGCNVVAYCDEVNVGGAATAHDLPETSLEDVRVGKWCALGFNGITMCQLVPIEKVDSATFGITGMSAWIKPAPESAPAPTEPEFATA